MSYIQAKQAYKKVKKVTRGESNFLPICFEELISEKMKYRKYLQKTPPEVKNEKKQQK